MSDTEPTLSCCLRAELHGPGRVAGLRRWISVMQALSMPKLQPLYTSSVSSNEGDWQTLTQVRRAAAIMRGSLLLVHFLWCPFCWSEALPASGSCTSGWQTTSQRLRQREVNAPI